ncbi:hypothetical protein AYJ01_04015 [Shewanella algae]|uniref:glycosyltransferase n=1 Tax=Shewanella algae TaxID=38313 RepID=UPI001183BCF3|nr:glycosyltransferase [Shewanella algae]TVK95903.1 hypothetical protein AYJ01_04015 [Shewanella algae]
MERSIYDELKSIDDLILIGPFYPLVGGVSVFLERLYSKNKDYVKYPFVGGSLLTYVKLCVFLLKNRKKVICLNTINIYLICLFEVLFKLAKLRVIFIDHNDRQFDRGFIFKIFFKSFLKKNDVNFVVGSSTFKKYRDNGIDNVLVRNSFIPPDREMATLKLKNYPDSILKFIDKSENLLVTNASNLILENQVDLYGFDLCIDLIDKLVNFDKYDVHLLMFVSNVGDDAYLNTLNSCIKSKNLQNNILIYVGNVEMWPIFSIATLSLRATSKDGFGISVAESIFMNCPCVASDVCERFKGAILFSSRSLDSLNHEVKKVLNDKKNKV